MGGPSTDGALGARGAVRLTNESVVASLPVAVPVLDIHTVGAGGGSVARVDAGGSLRVGPESAGADPGPAAYGRSLLPTVTDANLVLGRFGGADLLGGDFPLDVSRSEQALSRLAREMSAAGGRKVSTVEAALGVVRVVGAGMERALRVVSVERGHDPRAFALVTFGGAGGLHAVELARALRIPRVVVPRRPGALSAHGALQSDVVKDLSRTVMLDAGRAGALPALEREFRRLEREARAALRREGFDDGRQRLARTVAARYRGQSFELEIEWTTSRGAMSVSERAAASLVERFERAHEARYGYRRGAGAEVELVSARLRALGLVEKLPRERARRCVEGETQARPRGRAHVHFAEGRRAAALYAREDLREGERLASPCVVTEYSSTTLVPPGARAYVDARGNLIVEP